MDLNFIKNLELIAKHPESGCIVVDQDRANQILALRAKHEALVKVAKEAYYYAGCNHERERIRQNHVLYNGHMDAFRSALIECGVAEEDLV